MDTLASIAAVRKRLGLIDETMRNYSVTNEVVTRSLDADDASGAISSPPTQAEVENIRDAVLTIADVLGTLIEDLKGIK